MRKRSFVAWSLCGLLCLAVPAQAAPLTNFDTWRGAVDLGVWQTEADISGTMDGKEFNLKDFDAEWRPFGGITYKLGGHWGLQYVYHSMAAEGNYFSPNSYYGNPDRSEIMPGKSEYNPRINLDYRGSSNELNLLYALKKDSRVAVFVGANRVDHELRGSAPKGPFGSLEGKRTHFQGGLTATVPLSNKWDAYGLVGVGTHGLFQGEAGFAYKMKNDWQANVGYRWFRVKDAFDEYDFYGDSGKLPHSAGDVKVQGITFGITHFFGPVAKEKAPAVVIPPAVVDPPAVETPQSEIEKELLTKKTIVLKGVNFDFDKDTLQPQGYAILNKVVEVANKYPQWDFLLVGHTDSIGTDAYNKDLSWRRVRTVQRYLISKGIAENRLALDAKGESQPIADNDTDEGRAQNRRVELSIE